MARRNAEKIPSQIEIKSGWLMNAMVCSNIIQRHHNDSPVHFHLSPLHEHRILREKRFNTSHKCRHVACRANWLHFKWRKTWFFLIEKWHSKPSNNSKSSELCIRYTFNITIICTYMPLWRKKTVQIRGKKWLWRPTAL